MHTSLNSGPAVASSAPYPAITVDCQNPQHALLISQNLSGPQGEMTAIYQYMYQDWILSALHPDIAAILKRIAKVEMHHLDIFGQLVSLLGGDPPLPGAAKRVSVRMERQYDQLYKGCEKNPLL